MNSTFTPRKGLLLAFNKAISEEWTSIIQKIQDGEIALPTTLTAEQSAAIEAIKAMNQSLLLNAVAGSGKTMTAKLGIDALFKRTHLHLEARTCHSLGYKAWREKIGRPFSSPFDGKMWKIAQESGIFDSCNLDKDTGNHPGYQAYRLARKAKVYGLVPFNQGSPLIEDREETWQDFADEMSMDLHPNAISIARNLLQTSLAWATVGYKNVWRGRAVQTLCADFDDMIYLPSVFSVPADHYDFICGDEIQDWSATQRQLVSKFLAPTGRFLGAGDPCQSIYAFRGADENSVCALEKEYHLESLPLTTNFRCAKSIIREAQKFDPRIQAWDGAPEGKVFFNDFPTVESLPGTVLCRNNAPNVRLALLCLGEGRPAFIVDREIGEQLAATVKEVTEGQDIPLDTFLEKLEIFIDKRIAKRPKQKNALMDKRMAFIALARNARQRNAGTTSAILSLLETLYPKEGKNPNAVIFSTIHKAKGLEWPHVAILDPELFGLYAKTDKEISQERNLRLVAVTRAKISLQYISSAAFRFVDSENDL